MNVAGEGEGNAAWRGAIEGPGAMGEQDAERVFRGGREPQGVFEVIVLGIIGTPVTRVVDPDEREGGAAPLDHVGAILHEHLSRIAHTSNDGVLAGVAVMVAEHGDHAQRCVQVPKRAHVVGDVRLGDVDHVARLHDQIGAQRVRLRDDPTHSLFGHVNAGMHVGEMRDAEPVESRRQVWKEQRAARERGGSLGAPNAVGRHAESCGRIGVCRAGKELATRHACVVRCGSCVGVSSQPLTHDVRRTTHASCEDIQGYQTTENPTEKLPGNEGRDVGDATDSPQAAGEHPHGNDAPGDVEEDEDSVEPPPRGQRQALAQVEVEQQLRRRKQQQVD